MNDFSYLSGKTYTVTLFLNETYVLTKNLQNLSQNYPQY